MDYYYIATLKFPRNPKHNPRFKQVGKCKTSILCSDSTGEHHCKKFKEFTILNYKDVS